MEKVIKQLNQLQADAHALYVAFHDYHWNVKGIHFFSVHEYTEKIYNEMSELFDELAERALQIGGKALTDLAEISAAGANVPRLKADSYTAIQVAEQSKAAYEYLTAGFRVLEKVASEAGDATSANMAQDYIADYEKKLWMLNASLA